MTRPGGFDLNAMMKQAQQMQADMAKAQEELKDVVVDASPGGGMIKVKVSGDLIVREIVIDPDAVDPEDVEMLQDMVLAAVNEDTIGVVAILGTTYTGELEPIGEICDALRAEWGQYTEPARF